MKKKYENFNIVNEELFIHLTVVAILKSVKVAMDEQKLNKAICQGKLPKAQYGAPSLCC